MCWVLQSKLNINLIKNRGQNLQKIFIYILKTILLKGWRKKHQWQMANEVFIVFSQNLKREKLKIVC